MTADMIRFDYSALQTVCLDAHAAEILPRQLEESGAERVLLLVSRTLNRETGAVAEIAAGLGDRCVGVFDGVRSHTPREDVLAALQQAREREVDALVAIGGGSVIDAAKALRFALNAGVRGEEELLEHARFGDGRRGALVGRTSIDRVPLIAVPTTLSGAEFSDNAGVTDTRLGRKEAYRSRGLCPRGIVYDPQLSRHTPQWLWLSTAIRSLDHAIEGYCSPDSHAYMQGQYLHAMRLFAESLPAMYAAPDDTALRSLNQQATWLACCALGRVRHGASHGIGYALGAMCGVPHGYTSCVMLPAVLAWNAEVNRGRQKAVAEALGGGDAAQALRALLQSLSLPTTLAEVGVDDSRLPGIAEVAAGNRVVQSNPRPIGSADEVMEILQLARG